MIVNTNYVDPNAGGGNLTYLMWPRVSTQTYMSQAVEALLLL